MLLMSTATGSRVAFHVYCHFLVAVEVAVEMAVDFQSGSRKKSGSRKVNNRRAPLYNKCHLYVFGKFSEPFFSETIKV